MSQHQQPEDPWLYFLLAITHQAVKDARKGDERARAWLHDVLDKDDFERAMKQWH